MQPDSELGAPARSTAGVVLDLVRSGRATTRADLRRLTGLSRTAVTARVSTLVSSGLLLAGEELASTGGRPPASLTVNADAGVVLAVAVGRSRTQVGVFDLRGEELASDSVDHPAGTGPAELMPRVVERAAGQLASRQSPLIAVGLSLPGTVDEVRGACVDSPVIPGWDGVELGPFFAPLTDAPLVMANDADVLAQSELLARGAVLRDALVVKASTGLGLGIISDGRLVKGHVGASGEIGHSRSPAAEGLACRCGRTGCLEAVAGGWALVGQAGNDEIQHVRDLVAAALAGDPTARGLLRESGRRLGELLAVLVNVLNPQAVVVGGDMAAAFDIVTGGIRESIYTHSTALATRDLQILPAAHGDRAGLVGCAALALDAVLSPWAVDQRLALA
ncbi:MAG: ROK family protein [Nocardioides sp.]